MKSCNTVSHRQAHSRDTTWARHVGTTCVSRGARAYHVTYFLESCPLKPWKYVSRLRHVLLLCLPILYVPLFVRHIMSDAYFYLKIEELLANRARKNKTRENDWALNKFNSWLITSIFGYQFTSFEQIPVDRLNNLSQNGGNHFDPLSNSRRKL